MTVIISEFGGKFAQVQGSMHVTASRIPHSSPWLSAINTFGNDGNLGAWHLSKTTPTAHLKHPLVVENVILEKPVMIYLLRPHTHTLNNIYIYVICSYTYIYMYHKYI